MFFGIEILLPNITINIRLAAFIPLLLVERSQLKILNRQRKSTYLVPHDALCIFSITFSSIPFLKVIFMTFTIPGRTKVKVNDHYLAIIICLVLARN